MGHDAESVENGKIHVGDVMRAQHRTRERSLGNMGNKPAKTKSRVELNVFTLYVVALTQKHMG